MIELSTVYPAQAVASAYHDDLRDIKRLVAAIGFYYDLAITRCPLPDVRKPPSGNWIFADGFDVPWAEPLTSR